MADFLVFEDHGGGWTPRTSYQRSTRKQVESQIAKLLSQDFSQTDEVERIAKRVAICEIHRDHGNIEHFALHEYEVKPAQVRLEYIK